MKRLAAVLEVDVETSRLGGKSLLGERVGGGSILQRAVDAVLRCERLYPVVLLVHQRQAQVARALLEDLPLCVPLETSRSDSESDSESDWDSDSESASRARCSWFVHDCEDLPQRRRLQRGRLWARDGWRGGLGETCFSSERGNPFPLAQLCRQQQWDRLMLVSAESPFLDAQVLDSVAANALDDRSDAPILMSTAPPGIGGDVIHARTLEQFCQQQVSFEYFFHIHRERPQLDPDILRLVSLLDEDVMAHRGRYVVDGQTSLQRARQLDAALSARLGAHTPPSVHDLLAVQREAGELRWGSLPAEIIVSGGGADGTPVAEFVWDRVLESLALNDELLVTWGCSGGAAGAPVATDPCHDPKLGERLQQLRHGGASGIHLQTRGDHPQPVLQRLLESGVDVISVDLDIPSQARAEAVGQGDDYARRVAGLEFLLEQRQQLDPAQRPFVVPAITLDRSNASDLDQCHDTWDGRADRLMIRGVEGERGERVPESIGVFAPPQRFACTRLQQQLWIHGDGRVGLCRRDPHVEYLLGDTRQQSLAEIWQGQPLCGARLAHQSGEWDRIAHCGDCASWFRLD